MSQGAVSLGSIPLSGRFPSGSSSAVPAAEWEQLMSAAGPVRDYARGDALGGPGWNTGDAFLLDRGHARLYRLSVGGVETTLRVAGPREFFGGVPLLGVREDRCFAVALRSASVARIPRLTLERLLRSRPQLVLALSRQLGARLGRIEDRVESRSVCEARSRVVECLLELAEEFGRPAGEAIVLEPLLTQEELATLVGTTRQTVNASLRSLQAEGLVETVRGGIRLDPRGLRSLSEAGREDASEPAAEVA